MTPINPNTQCFSRRRLLKFGGALLTVVPSIRLHMASAQTPAPTEPIQASVTVQPTQRPFGRAIQDGLIIRNAPSTKADKVRTLRANDVIPTQGQVNGNGPTTYNPIWYQTLDGFIHSSYVQPCDNTLNKPLSVVGSEGVWGEVTVPITELRAKADETSGLRARLYFGTVFRIRGVPTGDDGKPWYVIADGNGGDIIGYIRAEHMRALVEADFAPISPDVPLERKRIDVDLKTQTTTAFEDGKPVFSVRVATGGQFRTADGIRNFGTNTGDHRIFRKIPGTRMTGGTPGFDYYNLPGISWVSYFTSSGIAFHGTYWHNDFGKPRSHGCVNMLPEDARWVFRWTQPVYQHTEQKQLIVKREAGSMVTVS